MSDQDGVNRVDEVSEGNVILRYSELVCDTIRAVVEREEQRIETAAEWLAATLRKDGLLHVTGTGHSHMFAEEVFYRAGGLMSVNPILEPSLMLHHGARKSTQMERLEGMAEVLLEDSGVTEDDMLIVNSNSGRNAVPVEMALGARKIGCKVVAVTSLQHSEEVTSRHSSGKRLFEVADLVIDNCVAYGDAAIDVPGMEQRMGPLSTIAGVFIMNSLVARAAQILAAEGNPPKVFVSGNVGHQTASYVETRAKELERLGQRVKAL